MAFAIVYASADRKRKLNLLRNAFHGEISDGDVAVSAFLNPLALEGDLRVLVGIKEILTAQIPALSEATYYAGLRKAGMPEE